MGVTADGGAEGALGVRWSGEVGMVPVVVRRFRVSGWSVGSGVGGSGAAG